jgi:hypothetical protein
MDTSLTLDPDTYEEKIRIAKNDINWEDVYQYRVKEVWYFDKQRSVMDVRILGIAPIYVKVLKIKKRYSSKSSILGLLS